MDEQVVPTRPRQILDPRDSLPSAGRLAPWLAPDRHPDLVEIVELAVGLDLSEQGDRFYINFSGTTLRTDRVMLGVILLGLLGVIMGEGVRRIERRYEKWRPSIN